MSNIIELKLLENKSVVAQMQGIPLAQENSYKIIAGEENSTIFKITSIPDKYASYQLTVEMVNAKGYGIAETPIINNQFILPLGMAVAGYGFVLIRAKGVSPETLDDEVVVYQPLKIKVWNTLPEWQTAIDRASMLKIENGKLYYKQDGIWYEVGEVGGGKASELENDIGFITNETAQITEQQVTNLPRHLQELRETVVGKSKNFILDYDEREPNADSMQMFDYYKGDTKQKINTYQEMQDYLMGGNLIFSNSQFGSNEADILLSAPRYLVFKISLLERLIVRIYDISQYNILNSGDNIYVTNTNVPDRWVTYVTDMELGISALEMQKVNLPTKLSQLENDSGFVSEDYVDNAIANAITTTLNTSV